jgi:hypothetical protein
MGTPRVGALGVADAVGDIYVVNSNGDLARLNKGTDEQVLISKTGAVNDQGDTVDLEWEDISKLARASLMVDATDAIFKKIDLGGVINNPQPKTRGTHSVLAYGAASVQGIAWQRYMPQIYSGDDLTLNIYWVAQTAILGDVVWAAAFEREEAGHNVDTDAFAALQTAAVSTAPGVLGDIAVVSIPFTQAQADAVAAGEPFRLFIQRTGDAVGDTMAGDAQIVRAVLTENVA